MCMSHLAYAVLCLNVFVPEGGHMVAGGPANNKAPLWVDASLTHLLYAACRPHLTHSDLGLHLEMSGRPAGDTVCYIKLSKNSY